MKVQRITIAILVIFVIGLGIFAQTLHQQEQRSRSRDLQHRGNYLVSLVALHPMENFLGSKKKMLYPPLSKGVGNMAPQVGWAELQRIKPVTGD